MPRAGLRAMACLLAPLLVAASGGSARAADYGYFVDVETEAELADLYASQEIDSGAYETLLQLLDEGVDLSTASRDELYGLPNLTYEEVDKIIAYRAGAGTVDPAALPSAGVLPERKLLAIAAFLVEGDGSARVDLHGRLRLRTLYGLGEAKAPATWLSARAHTLHRALEAGLVGVLTRNQVGDAVWDENRGALTADAPSLHVRLPKFFVQYRSERLHAVAGTFRIGFGQRLVLDNTSRYAPNGIQIDDQIYYNRDAAAACRQSAGELSGSPCAEGSGDGSSNLYEAPDFKWPERFRGVALGYRSPEFGAGSSLSAYAFASLQTRGLYQYELVDRDRCPDPNDDSAACQAPRVYLRGADPLAPTSSFQRVTLPNLFNELAAGGNWSWFFHRRAHLGMTGYGATSYFLTDGANLGFQEWSRWPWTGSGKSSWGAVGADFAWGRSWFDLFGEVARSVDGQPTGGGFAGIVRATASFRRQEIELSARYYDSAYNNPFARPISAADEYDGVRASNESGVRLRYIGAVGDLEVRSYVDLWWDLVTAVPKVRFRLRAEYQLSAWLAPALIVDVYDKDAQGDGSGQCFDGDPAGEGGPAVCNGRRVQLGANLKLTPSRRLSLTLRYLHRLVDDPKYTGGTRHDLTAWGMATATVTDWLRLRARLRYLSEDVTDGAAGEESVWVAAEALLSVRRALLLKARYELLVLVDSRASTMARTDNPEHWVRLEAEYRF